MADKRAENSVEMWAALRADNSAALWVAQTVECWAGDWVVSLAVLKVERLEKPWVGS